MSGEHFRALVDPIFQCLEMLINSETSDELDILSSLVRIFSFYIFEEFYLTCFVSINIQNIWKFYTIVPVRLI